MERIIIGKKENNIKYDFRETCFGICEQDGKLLVGFDTKKDQYTFIGGGIEKDENRIESLKREFIEESGIIIKNIRPFIIIDCYWLADGKYPLNSLANFYLIDIEKIVNANHEYTYKFIVPNKIDLPLPYQKEALKIYIEKNNL